MISAYKQFMCRCYFLLPSHKVLKLLFRPIFHNVVNESKCHIFSSAFRENWVICDIRLFVGRTKYDHVGYPKQKVSLGASFLRCDYEGLDSVNPNPIVTLPIGISLCIPPSLMCPSVTYFSQSWVISDIQLFIGRTKYDYMGYTRHKG